MGKKANILMEISSLTSPMAMMAFSKMIEASKSSKFIRDGMRILFLLNHEAIRRKLHVKSVVYWAIIQQLIDTDLVFRHDLALQGDRRRIYIEFNFRKLDTLGSDFIDSVDNSILEQ